MRKEELVVVYCIKVHCIPETNEDWQTIFALKRIENRKEENANAREIPLSRGNMTCLLAWFSYLTITSGREELLVDYCSKIHTPVTWNWTIGPFLRYIARNSGDQRRLGKDFDPYQIWYVFFLWHLSFKTTFWILWRTIYLLGLCCFTDIMNHKPRLAWELYLKMETSGESFSLLQLIANDCYKVRFNI